MKKLLVLTTGGTIDKVYFDALSEYKVGDPAVTAMLNAMNVAFEFEVIEVCRKDSLELTDDDREGLKRAIESSDASAILITHGTDTMVKSAQHIGHQPGKTIVFTGAMQPAAFKDTDALFNVGTAIGALNGQAEGAFIAMSGRVYPADNVQKNYDAKRFEAKVD